MRRKLALGAIAAALTVYLLLTSRKHEVIVVRDALAPDATANTEQRRQRDALRQRILTAIVDDAATLPPPTPLIHERSEPTALPRDLVRGLPGVPAGNFPTAYFTDIYKEQLGPLTRACYEATRARRPDAGGSVMIRYLVVGAPNIGGIVEDATVDESTLGDDELESCIHESVMTLTFDRAPDKGGFKEAGFQMVFAPPAPPDGGM